MIYFEWDCAKSKANERKHGVSFKEAQSVFYDDFARQYFDEGRSDAEERFIMVGLSNRARILLVCHCEKLGGETIRIISARKATQKERSQYEGPLK
jgi:uncharacterized protein